jgi:ubiquinone/menaquinone biosynthesis C-methylase UbiE
MSNKIKYEDLVNQDEVLKHLSISQGMAVGDLGCGGSGIFAIPASNLVGEDGMVICVDILKNALSAIDGKSRLYNVHNFKLVWSDLEKENVGKLPSESLDRGMIINVLHQSKDKKSIIKEALRLLKPGGLLLIMDRTESGFRIFPTNGSVVTKEEVEEVCKSLGIQKVETFEPTRYYFALVYKK